jgi:hypothetical protein
MAEDIPLLTLEQAGPLSNGTDAPGLTTFL